MKSKINKADSQCHPHKIHNLPLKPFTAVKVKPKHSVFYLLQCLKYEPGSLTRARVRRIYLLSCQSFSQLLLLYSILFSLSIGFLFIFSPLSLLKSTAAGLSAVTGAFSTDIDLSCTAAVIFIISAAVRITNHIQFGLRRFKKIFKDSACVFRKTCAAGIICTACMSPVYCNRTLTAAPFRIVYTVFCATFQFRHNLVPPDLSFKHFLGLKVTRLLCSETLFLF